MTKNFKLLFTMLLLVLGGANSVWGTIIYPTSERWDRKDKDKEDAWASGYPKLSSASTTQIEWAAGYWIIETFNVYDLDNVSSLTLKLTSYYVCRR